MAPITLPAEFGYVGLVVAATFFMNFWHMMRIGSLRKKYKIEYPAMTSDKHQDFMYAQRVHQNNLEQLPFFYVNLVCRVGYSPNMLILTAIHFHSLIPQCTLLYFRLFRYHSQLLAAAANPTTAAIMGAVWVIGRIVYSLGYYSAPSYRVPGAIGSSLTLAALAIYNIYSSLKLLKVF